MMGDGFERRTDSEFKNKVRAEKAEARVKELAAERDSYREYGDRRRAVEAERDRLAARMGEQHTALKWVEAVMSIVEPRSDKAEYLECLTAVRLALASDDSAVTEVIAAVQSLKTDRDVDYSGPLHLQLVFWDNINKLFQALDRLDGREADDAE